MLHLKAGDILCTYQLPSALLTAALLTNSDGMLSIVTSVELHVPRSSVNAKCICVISSQFTDLLLLCQASQ